MEEPIRICLVSFMFAPLVGGAEVRVEKQARQLQALGQEVTVVTLRHNKEWRRTETVDGLPIVRVGGIYHRQGWLRLGRLAHIPIDIAMFLTLWRLRHRYDVLHIGQIGTLAAVAALIGKLTHKPVIVSITSTGSGQKQERAEVWLMADTLTGDTSFLKVDDFREAMAGDISYFPRSALGGNILLDFVRRSDAYYQILSSRSYSYLASHGFRAEQIVHIPTGIDTEKFRPALQQPDGARPERAILCLARLQYAKGVDVLLHAWARMMREPAEWRTHLNLKLLIAGIGPLRTQLERIATELGIQDSVEFLGLRKDVIALLQQAWGFVLPSRWEGMPNALLEAMSCGLPCVATRVSGSEDIIVDGVNGLLVEPEQPAEMARALRRILEDSDLAQQLGQEARATIEHDYQLTLAAERCLQLYRRLLAQRRHVLPLALQERGEP